MEAGDFERRFNFCTWILPKITEDPDFILKILFTDEATFNRCGIVNLRNNHVWADENPHALIETNLQRQFSTNIWTGILGDEIIGPVILPRLIGHVYMDFLQFQLPELLENVSLQMRKDMWFMHDGAPPYYAASVREYLRHNFGNKWIGRGGPIPWPARSPDLNPLDFFFWGHLKTLVYSTPVLTLEELQQRIEFTSNVIRNVMVNFRKTEFPQKNRTLSTTKWRTF